ncbi:MAG: hemolysin III family protein [Phycisphaerales bacterium]
MPLAAINDPVATITHAVAAIAFAIFAVPLVRRGRGSPVRRASLIVFAATAVLLLTASATFHALPSGTAGRAVLQRVDHAAIFLLIAGTFTGIHGILFTGPLRWGVLTFIWIGAAAGIVLKTIFFDTFPEALGISLYLAMGWVGALTMIAVWRLHGGRHTVQLIAAGLAYTVGAVFEFTGWPTIVPGVIGPHDAFHIAVIVGLGIFWMFIYQIAGEIPPRKACPAQNANELPISGADPLPSGHAGA